MAFGFPAYHTQRYQVPPAAMANVGHAIRWAISSLGWSIRNESMYHIEASTGINLLSWGESVSIHFMPDYSITITSKCAWPLQCFDWGKNQSNVEALRQRTGF